MLNSIRGLSSTYIVVIVLITSILFQVGGLFFATVTLVTNDYNAVLARSFVLTTIGSLGFGTILWFTQSRALIFTILLMLLAGCYSFFEIYSRFRF
jgi:hypothetical protein